MQLQGFHTFHIIPSMPAHFFSPCDIGHTPFSDIHLAQRERYLPSGVFPFSSPTQLHSTALNNGFRDIQIISQLSHFNSHRIKCAISIHWGKEKESEAYGLTVCCRETRKRVHKVGMVEKGWSTWKQEDFSVSVSPHQPAS